MKMENKVHTAEELLRSKLLAYSPSGLFEQTLETMLEFAKMHVKLALEEQTKDMGTGCMECGFDKESILSYDYSKIK